MNRKIIIISHDSEKYQVGAGYPLSKLITEAKHISKSYISANCLIASKFTNLEALIDYLKCNKPDDVNLLTIKEFIVTANPNPESNIEQPSNVVDEQPDKWCDVPEDLIKYYKEDEKSDNNPYDKIEIKNDNKVNEIFILYWNRIRPVNKPGALLSLVCKDCQIDNSTDNMLYIHESEWLGNAKSSATEDEKGDNLLIFEKKKTDRTTINDDILKKLIELNFSFAASFKHIDAQGRFFKKILNLEFGERILQNEMGLIEKKTGIKDFINLKTEIESLW